MTFLIVDDMENMRRSIRTMLKLIGYGKTFLEAANGLIALDLLDSNEEEVHFIISDWNMPEMSGTGLLNRVRADRRFREIPFLMITAEATKEIVAEAAENEVDAYLTKPFVTASLEKKVKDLIHNATNPDQLSMHLKNVRILDEKGDIDGAIGEAKLAIAANERSSRPLRELGRLFLKKNDVDQSLKAFQKAVAINQLDVTSFHYLGQLYYGKGEIEAAINSFSRAMDISPRHVDRAVKFATLLLQKNLYKQAEKFFALVLRNYGTNKKFKDDIAERCLVGGLYDMAIRLYREALQTDPAEPGLNRKLGIALRRKGQNKDAIPYLEIALESSPDDIELLSEIAQCYLDMKKPVPAERYAVKMIRLDAQNKKAKEIIRQCD